jgi:hypothetical protein
MTLALINTHASGGSGNGYTEKVHAMGHPAGPGNALKCSFVIFSGPHAHIPRLSNVEIKGIAFKASII